MELLKQVGMDGKEIRVCQACVGVPVHLVQREMVALTVDQVHKVHLVSLCYFIICCTYVLRCVILITVNSVVSRSVALDRRYRTDAFFFLQHLGYDFCFCARIAYATTAVTSLNHCPRDFGEVEV